jgi:His/Glu/Gln/Arg/opine family amino acid ABC transporter permease subunit
MLNISLFKTSLAALLQGATLSIEIAFCALVIGTIGGTLLSLMLLYGNKVVRVIAHAYVTLIRGTPMLVQIMALFFILPYFGIMLPAFISAVVAIGMNSIAYISQTIRAGIQAVGRGQIEAAQALGFSHYQITRLIVLPQAFRTVLPSLGNECITLIKDSSLASVIGVAELTHQGSIIMNRTYDAVTAYAGVALIYLLITSAASLLVHLLERKMHYVKN